jgi:glycosyltransferase involved in cell wall biosynthesis
MSPVVSIVLPTYNRLPLLREAVDSVLAQTLTDWELIVVDDGSTDDSVAWLESLNDSRVVVVREPHTANRSRLRNAGVARSRASWIAFLDSDDLWLPVKLATQLERIAAHAGCRWSCTGVQFIDGEGNPISQRAGASYRAQSGWILERLLTFTAAATMPTLIVHRSLFDEVGGFDETFLLREDYEFELRLAAHSEIHALDEALTIVRHHAARTSSSKRVAELHRGSEMVFRKVESWTTDARVRVICRRQCAKQLALRARALSREGEHREALASAGLAIRRAPFAAETWKSAASCALRFFRGREPPVKPSTFTREPTEPSA